MGVRGNVLFVGHIHPLENVVHVVKVVSNGNVLHVHCVELESHTLISQMESHGL